MSPLDYLGVADVRLDFGVGQSEACHFVNITDDNICENNPTELFSSNLVLGGGEGPILIEPQQAEIIIDDTNGPECGTLIR